MRAVDRLAGMEDTLALAAIEGIEADMVVGLGTGRAASRCIHALAAARLNVRCVATSVRSGRLAESLGLVVESFEEVRRVDFLFDGADEVDGQLRLLKGAGGAMTREKIIARAADRCVYVVDESKLVSRLGERFALPVEVLAFGLASIRERLSRAGLAGSIRVDESGRRYLTDEGNPVLDLKLASELDPELVVALLADTPGVVGHGMFLREADAVLVERAGGEIDRLVRA